MNEYISTAQFARSKESVIEHQQLIEDCMKVFNERSQNSANFKVIHSIKFLNDYTFEIRWASANAIDVLQAGRALRLFSDEMLKADGMRKKSSVENFFHITQLMLLNPIPIPLTLNCSKK